MTSSITPDWTPRSTVLVDSWTIVDWDASTVDGVTDFDVAAMPYRRFDEPYWTWTQRGIIQTSALTDSAAVTDSAAFTMGHASTPADSLAVTDNAVFALTVLVCPSDNCTSCAQYYYVDWVAAAPCGATPGGGGGTFNGTTASGIRSNCAWGNMPTGISVGPWTMAMTTGPSCSSGIWSVGFTITYIPLGLIGSAVYTRTSTGNGDCPVGTFNLSSEWCLGGMSGTWPSTITVYS